MIITILSGFISFCLALLGCIVSIYVPKKPKHRNMYIGGFIFLSIIAFGLVIIQDRENEKNHKEIIANILGEGIPSVIPNLSFDGSPQKRYFLSMINSGNYNLYDVRIRIQEAMYANDDTTILNRKLNEIKDFFIGSIPPKSGLSTNAYININPDGGEYIISIIDRSGKTTQTLKFYLKDGKMLADSKIIKDGKELTVGELQKGIVGDR